MDRFEQLLEDYADGTLDARGRAELALMVDSDPGCLEAFIDVVSNLRIRRLQRT